MNYLFFDTETTGLPKKYNAPFTDTDNYPRLVQLGWILYNDQGTKLAEYEFIITPNGFEIPAEVSKVHGITQEKAIEEGWELELVLALFFADLLKVQTIVGHNLSYDIAIIGAEMVRLKEQETAEILVSKSQVCTMRSSTNFCQIPGKRAGQYKYPKLHELYQKLFNEPLAQTHTALDDIQNTAKCYFELKRLGVI